MMTRLGAVIFSLAFVLMSTSVVFAEYPSAPEGFVNDYADILVLDARGRIEERLTQLADEGVAQVTVVTIASLDGMSIEEYAVTLFERWGIGEKDKDNGVLLLVAPSEREVRIEVGYGLEGALTDLESGWIIRDEITPKFKEGDLSGGIEAGVRGIERAIREEVVVGFPDDMSEDNPGQAMGLISLIFLVLYAAPSLLGLSRSWWLGGVLGVVMGVGVGVYLASFLHGAVAAVGLMVLGLLIDYLASAYGLSFGGGGFGGSGSRGGFGGFGGGSSGGGGASGRW